MSVLRRCLLVAAALAVSACEPDVTAPHGSPALMQVLWEVQGIATVIWSRDPDAAVAPAVPAAGFKVDFVFDRRLDGARVEDTVNGLPVPKANPPIAVGWPDFATVMSDPPFGFDVYYNSLATWGPATTSVFVQLDRAGFPSGTPVTFTLDPNGLTSVYGEPMDGPTEITVMTEPLAVSLQLSTATVPTSYRASIAFSTRGPAVAALGPFVQVTAGGQALPFELVYDAADPRRVLVQSRCGGVWPAGARVDVTVGAGAPDGFGRPLGAPVTGSFMTAAIAPADGGCGLDAGTGDGGSPAGGTPDAGVPDAAPDAPAPPEADAAASP
jgi:hypothetical protein